MILFYTFMAICIAFSIICLLVPVIGMTFFIITWPMEKAKELARRVRSASHNRRP